MQSRACDETWKKAAWINNIKHIANNVHNAIEQGNAKWGAHTQEDTQNNVALNEQYVVQHSQDNQDVWHDAQEEQTNGHGSFGSDETNQAFYPSIDSVLKDTLFSWQKLLYIVSTLLTPMDATSQPVIFKIMPMSIQIGLNRCFLTQTKIQCLAF